MGTSDDYFVATGDFGREGGLPGFWTETDANNNSKLGVGGQMVGRVFGVWGQGGAGQDDIFDRYQVPEELIGVIGASPNGGLGVLGQSGATSTAPIFLTPGVLGAADTSAGVVGWSTSWNGVEGWATQGTGVLGVSNAAYGVQGASTSQPGVLGWSENDSGVVGGSGPDGTQGPMVPNTSNTAGVIGTSDRQHGTIGTSNASVGVIGFSANDIGVLGYTLAGPYAGLFLGNLAATGTKSAVVPFPDGTHRALYCMESPELWFEDFGTAKLKRGRAVVPLDADFAKVITRGDYKVFFTPEGDCRGLFAYSKSAASFEVRELMGGNASIAFSYRIVGRRKDIKKHRRFAKIDMRLPVSKAGTHEARKLVVRTASQLRAAVAHLQKATSPTSNIARKPHQRRAPNK